MPCRRQCLSEARRIGGVVRAPVGSIAPAWWSGRSARLGAVVFLALFVFYAWWAWDHLQWVLLIGSPMLLIAGLYGWAWVVRKRSVG